MRKLIIHIGLPKTATTALQKHIFENCDCRSWNYIGVRQPRKSKQIDVYYQLMDCFRTVYSDNKTIEDCKRILKQCSDERTLLISEEMFCVDTQITWQEKIKRLAKITQEYEVTVLVTVREPLAAMFSLYCELWPIRRQNYPTFQSFADTSNQAKIFDYQYLSRQLEQSFRQGTVKMVPFEAIRSGRDFLLKIEKATGCVSQLKNLPKENTRKKGAKNTAKTRLHTLREFVCCPVTNRQHWLLSTPNRAIRLLMRPAVRLWGEVELPFTSTSLPLPAPSMYTARFNESNQWLFENHSIDYRKNYNTDGHG